MNFSLILLCCAVFCHAKELYEVFGNRNEVVEMKPILPRPVKKSESIVDIQAYKSLRSPEHCVFPIDVLIIQDATQSLYDDWDKMKDIHLPAMVDVLSETHPGSRFAVMTHRDKPIWPLGNPDDYCLLFSNPLSTNVGDVVDVYNATSPYGGGDGPECQFSALVAASQHSMFDWNPEHTRLMVVLTDAQPHFDQDGFNTMGLPPTSGIFNEADPELQCVSEYYPSPAHVKASLSRIGAYLAAVVYDPHYQDGLVARAWQWVIRDFGESDSFLNLVTSDADDNFWHSLSEIITELESVECPHDTTPSPAASEFTETTPYGDPCPPCPTEQCELDDEAH